MIYYKDMLFFYFVATFLGRFACAKHLVIKNIYENMLRDKNFKKTFLMIVGFLFFVPTLEAQQIVNGRITDATDGMPVENVSIFIANTTIGTISDKNGNYSITVSGNGSFEIVVSHVAFKSHVHKINEPQPFHRHDVALEIYELPEEVVVIARSNYYQSDVDFFWSRILGDLPTGNELEVLNPDKVYFRRNRDNILNVSCREPIEIINHQMGYRIKYVLHSFQHDYKINETSFSGMPHFEELIPQDNLQKKNWEKKRKEVYAISFTHFLRALYRKQIHIEGFLLVKKDLIEKNDRTNDGWGVWGVSLNEILQFEDGELLVNIEETLLLMCYSKPVTERMISRSIYALRRGDKLPIVMELLPQQFIIFSDGTYSGFLPIQYYQTYIFGLSTVLPVEYGK